MSVITKTQKWSKAGVVYIPDGHCSWMLTHAANPFAEYLYDDIFRIYFSSRDKENRSSIGYIDVDINAPFKIIAVSKEPVLSPGEIGTFDDSGVSLGCICNISNKKYLYYVGWNLAVTVPWRNSIGLAIYNERINKFEKFSKAPIIDRNNVDPFSVSYPYVIDSNGIFKMWYGSNLSWGKNKEDMEHVIKYAESEDGINWKREGKICLNFKNKEEYAISKPFVIQEKDIYKVWYSYRGLAYRIGYAESLDGINWERKDDEIDLSVSRNDWDSEMVEYPFVFDHSGNRYMLYNGNSYGKTGFGIAVLK